MMRQMREATKPIMLFTAAAFVALMVFQWGMDITGISSGSLGEIGRVNGDAVTYDAYMAAYRNLYDQVQRSQEEPINSQQNQEIEDAAFDEVVNQILITQELGRRGITVTDEEIRQAAQYSPPADLRASFANEAGQFDMQAYQTWLSQLPQDQLLALEAYYRDIIPRGKLLRQVSSGIYLSDGALWQQYQDRNEFVEIRFVPLNPATRYDDADFPIPASDVEAYWDENQEEFAVPARASVRVVVMGTAPTAADTVASGERAQAVYQEILGGADFVEVAARESSDEQTAPLGGELGTFAQGRMVAPFDSAVFNGPVGRVMEPVRTGFGWHIIEVHERWAQDSAQARHVLIPVSRTDDSEIALLTRADSLEDMGEDMTLAEAAANLGLEVLDLEITRDFPFVAGAGQITEGADWIFEDALPGDVSPVFENAQAFYAVELISSEPEGILPLEDARGAIESTLVFDLKLERAIAEGDALVAQVRGGEALVNVAADAELEIRNAGPFTRSDFVPGMGRQNSAVGAAFGLPVGGVSDVVATPANAYVIEVLSHTPADSTAWLDQRDQQRQTAVAVLQQTRLAEWIEALRAAADIVDRRDEVLQPADEENTMPQVPMVF